MKQQFFRLFGIYNMLFCSLYFCLQDIIVRDIYFGGWAMSVCVLILLRAEVGLVDRLYNLCQDMMGTIRGMMSTIQEQNQILSEQATIISEKSSKEHNDGEEWKKG